jgi:hypothetical protein
MCAQCVNVGHNMPKIRSAVAGCIALGVVLVAVLVVLALFLAYTGSCEMHALRDRAPASFSHAYIVHGAHRTERVPYVAALQHVATLAVSSNNRGHGRGRVQRPALANANANVHVWPATYPALEHRAHASYAACRVPSVTQGQFGCATSHMRLLKHALRSDPALAEPKTTAWVLVFEDDAQLQLQPSVESADADADADADAVTIMREAIERATALGVNAVFFGWWFREAATADGATRVAPHIWRVDGAPIRAHAYALRGAIAPAVLHMLRRRRCYVPVDVLLRQTLPSSLLVTHSPHVHRIRVGRGDDALFGQAGLGSDTR